MRYLTSSLFQLALGMSVLGGTTAHATLVDYSDSNRTIAGNSQQSFSLLSAGALTATDDYTISGTLTLDFTGEVNFGALFLITDGTVSYGGEVDEIGAGGTAQVLTSANAGDAFTAPEDNGNAVSNQAAPDSFVVDFTITGDADDTTATVTVGSNSNSISDSVIPDGFIASFNAENGFSLVLVNLEDDPFTFDDIDITIVPEPMAASLIGGLALVCLTRRRSA
ncbi:MAG: hypothetical protein AAGJ38_10020 [Planctomycetota bacterium]